MPLLRMNNIGKSFAGNRVLEGVDFELEAGELHLLAGENGAGKSTLIKILAGVHREYAGSIEIDGATVRFRSPQHAALLGISVIHQELSLIPSLSVRDNIFLGRERRTANQWVRYRQEEEECRKLMDTVGIQVDPRKEVAYYPLSIQQTIEIAKALSFDARIIVMDEPTSALTEPEVKKLFEIIDGLKKRGCGIIYISHKMEEIYRISDRITVLRDGKKIGTAPAAELPRAKLVQWMVGREIEELVSHESQQTDAEKLRVENFTVPDPAGAPRAAVDNVSFNLRAGEILGLGGLQGAGASELLNALFGTYGRNASGSVTVNNRRYTPCSPANALRHGIALLTNDRKSTGLVLGLSIASNITLASLKKCSPAAWMRAKKEQVCATHYRGALGIRCASLDQEVETLSGGNQQKVALAKWLATDPQILFLDEPTRGVDIGAKHEIYALMKQWTQQGIAIVLITSEMPELLALSDRILVMHRGRFTAEYKRGEATPEKILKAAMADEG